MNLSEICDHLEISQIVQRYGRAVDEKQYDSLANVFTIGALVTFAVGEHSFEGKFPEVISASFSPVLDLCYWTCHLISEPVIDLKGDTARATTRVIATHAQKREDESPNIWVVTGDYSDELLRTPNGWRIHHRIGTFPCQQGTFVSENVRVYKKSPHAVHVS